MENLAQILELYQADDRTQTILTHLKAEKPARIQLLGMAGSQECFALTAIWKANSKTHLFIASSKEEAAYVHNTLEVLCHPQKIHFLPDSFKRPMNFEAVDTHNTLLKTETVNQLTGKEKDSKIIVTYPEAIVEKVVAPELLEENRIEIKIGENLDIATIREVLIEYGFKYEEFVYEPGHFSIRGDIVDIFSYANEYPFRIELFDEEVESIRIFDPMTQLSQKKLAFLSIVPNVQAQFKQDDKVPLTSILPENSVIWIKKPKVLLEHLQIYLERFNKYVDKASPEQLEELPQHLALEVPDVLLNSMENFDTIYVNRNHGKLPSDTEINYKSSPQTNFNKNFSLLIDDFNKNSTQNVKNFLFVDSNKQMERFYNIFSDMEAGVKFFPIVQSIHEGFIDPQLKIACYTDHQIFQRFHRYKLKKGFTKDKAIGLQMLRSLKPGDYVTHIDHGVGRFSGLEKIDINGHIQESVRLFYQNNDVLYVSINSLHKISKYTGKEGTKPRLNKLGSEAWKNLKARTKKKIRDIAGELIKLYAKRKHSPGHAFPPDGYLQNELEASFIYEDTPDQFIATNAVKEDMCKEYPMDRLICGDVGFGKTEIAVRAAFKSVVGGKQVAILVPTTILALQHYRTFSERLKQFGVTVDYINRFRTTKEKKLVFEALKEGKVDIVIGTHGLLNKQVGFKDLGLLIIDEEQKFGVAAKEKLRNIKINVDTLTLTATPIPRTLQFSLMAARDLSIIRTPPPNRQPIHTEVRVFSEELIKEAIYYEIDRGGQVFFVHNRVKSLPKIAALVQRLCPDVNIKFAHGQMESKQLESTLLSFIDKEFDVLVSTNIIETGLDIPNANTMIINDAHHFGISDLHQLRGRVGRSNKKAFCYLFSQPISVLTSDARKRLKAIEEFSDLGSGFEIAMRDLDIRGAGNLLGAEQSGFISDIGYETYQRILEEAMQELKEGEFKELFKDEMKQNPTYVRDVQIDTDTEMYIPDEYVSNIQERLNLYTQLNNLETEEAIEQFDKMLTDRFGKVPISVKQLYIGLRIRNIAKKMGFERVVFKKSKLRCFFIENAQSPFYESSMFSRVMNVLTTAKAQRLGLKMKQTPRSLILIKEKIETISQVHRLLKELEEEVVSIVKG